MKIILDFNIKNLFCIKLQISFGIAKKRKTNNSANKAEEFNL